MDARIIECQGDLAAMRLELRDAQEKQTVAKDRQLRLLDPKTLKPKVFNGARKQWRS